MSWTPATPPTRMVPLLQHMNTARPNTPPRRFRKPQGRQSTGRLKTWSSTILIALCAGKLLLMAACIPRNAVEEIAAQPWATGPSEVIAPNEPPRRQSDYFDPTDRRIRLTGAVNETVAFQFVLTADDDLTQGLEISFEDLVSTAGTIPRDAVRIYRHWPVTVERYPNWYLRSVGPSRPRKIPDALVPIDATNHGQPFTLRPKTNLILWVDIRIPFIAAPGEYTGAIVVQDGEGRSQRTPVMLDVRDVLLSSADAITTLARVQLKPIIETYTQLDPDNLRLILEDPDARRVLMKTFRLLHEHGLSPVTDEIKPGYQQDLAGRLDIDWTQYDDFCGPLIDGSAYRDGRPSPWWPIPVDLTQPDPSQHGGTGATAYTAILRKHLEAAAAHFQEKSWLERSYVFFDLPHGANPRRKDLEIVRRVATLSHLANPRLNVVSRLIPQPMIPFGWAGHRYEDLTSLIDIWSTPARYQHGPTMQRLQTLGRRTWLLPDRPPFSGSMAIEAPPIHARSLAWQAFLQGHDAIVLDRVTQWPPDVFDRPITDRRRRSDTWLVYPGSMFGLDAPIPSVRLKQLQLGIQDYQRLRLLEKNGRGATARLIAGSLIKAAGTEAYGDNYQDGRFGRRINDPAVWELARKILDDELADAMLEHPAATGAAGANRADWAKFLSSTRRIEAWPESARLILDERPGQEGFLTNWEVAVRNELRTPLVGTLSFGTLPPGANSISDIVRVGPLPEMALTQKRLTTKTALLPPTDLDGHTQQQVVFDAGTSGMVNIDAILSIVQAPPVPVPITVDGRLDDWPPNNANAASDFRILTTYGGSSRPRKRAESQTIAYFCRRDDVLYIGIHAAAPAQDASRPVEPTPLRNFVEYQDLMPVGEDLVEIIIDPTNAATQSEDLFHIVIKSTGNPNFQRGIATVPPIGKVRPWPQVVPECCVVHTAAGWTAELAIPLSTFGEEAAANHVWGINLARCEPIHGEYSDWARAPRYCYDPRSLGNLVWPE